ncbi:hypothetical protein EAF00_010020 [Botryotinia globosa]|nr:hypothetical protein EAF00_010020 [Botryotinia globosa]
MDVELGVDEEISDPDIPIASIETDEETCSPGIKIGPGKGDTTKVGEMVLDPDIPIPSIKLFLLSNYSFYQTIPSIKLFLLSNLMEMNTWKKKNQKDA